MKYVIRPLFAKYQKELVAFANTSCGKDFVSQFGGKELKEKYPIVKVTPDGVHQHLGGNTFRAVFYPRSPYVKHFADVLTMVDIAKKNGYDSNKKELIIPHFLGATRLLKDELPQIYLTSDTFNPDASPESTSVDGWARLNLAGQTWANLRDGSGNGSADSGASGQIMTRTAADSSSNQWNNITRAFFFFDTSSLTASVSVSAADFEVYVTLTVDDFGGSQVALTDAILASNTAIANSDYEGTVNATTQQATNQNYSSLSTSAYNTFSLNATGISNVNTTGISKFGMRSENDRANSAPTWGASNVMRHVGDYADGSNKPKLTVTYTLPAPRHGFVNHNNPGIV